ncbi:hypothetical protein B0H15DRAFT_404359 [Mycena belliarum]|uniref:F-box domain-containing protein n=1 Tax=Mycena belliarum TaxID=1033014 RepID=A0AAD6XNS3_9AGAR|nr:hypothetical protein B0H15DRAFT_404359 [Mycena belliae]
MDAQYSVGTLPAVFSLPNELLVAIAVVSQESESESVLYDSFVCRPERTLSHVCRHFRKVLIGTSILWTLVGANLTLEGSVETMKLYLTRSGTCRIRVSLYETSPMVDEDSCVMEGLAQLLLNAHRISRMAVRVGSEGSISTLLGVFSDAAAPALQRLEIRVTGPELPQFPLRIFSSDPPQALTALILNGFIPKLPLPPWTASLTHLETELFEETADSCVLELVARCPLLVHVSLDLSRSPVLQRFGRIALPSVKSLHVGLNIDAGAPYLLELIGFLDAPVLTDLVVRGSHGNQISPLFDSSSAVNSSFPALTSLSFINRAECGGESGDASFVPYTRSITSLPPRHFPALSSLTLVNQCFTYDVVREIVGPTSPPWSLLETLTVCPPRRPSWESTFPDVILSMRRRGHILPKLRFSRSLFSRPDWDELGVRVEEFDPVDAIAAVHRY